MVSGISSPTADIRHTAACGIGLCAKFGGEVYAPACAGKYIYIYIFLIN